MRISDQNHNLARLRLLLDRRQQEMADLIGCSKATVQAVELGKLNLSPNLAKRIATATGVSVRWLLHNNIKAKPITEAGEPYGEDHFKAAQAAKTAPASGSRRSPVGDLFNQYCHLRAIIESAAQRGEGELALFDLECFVNELRARYGFNGKVYGSDSSIPAPSGSEVERLVRDDLKAYSEARAKLFGEDGVVVSPAPPVASVPVVDTPKDKAARRSAQYGAGEKRGGINPPAAQSSPRRKQRRA